MEGSLDLRVRVAALEGRAAARRPREAEFESRDDDLAGARIGRLQIHRGQTLGGPRELLIGRKPPTEPESEVLRLARGDPGQRARGDLGVLPLEDLLERRLAVG